MLGKVALIFLHGSGSSGRDMRFYLESAPLPGFDYRTFRQVADDLSIDLITPTAETRPYTAMAGERCRVWFDRPLDFTRNALAAPEDTAGHDKSLSMILEQVRSVEAHYDHIIIGGFSMGGCLALHTLRQDLPDKLRAVFSIGSFLVQNSAVVLGPLGRTARVPIMMMHGEEDPLIRPDWGSKTAANLLLRELDVQFRTYPHTAHETSPEQLADLMLWLKDVLQVHKAEVEKCQPKMGGAQASEAKAERYGTGAKDAGDKGDKGDDDALLDAVEAQLQLDSRHGRADTGVGGGAGAGADVGGARVTSRGQAAGMHIPYAIDELDENLGAKGKTSAAPRVRVRYAVPQELVGVLTSRPVLACGAMFEILEDRPSGIQVILSSSDPDSTAIEIGRRLQNRIDSGGASVNACPMS